MTKKDRSTVTLHLILVAVALGAAVAVALDGIWRQDSNKILIAIPFLVIALWFVNYLENQVLEEMNRTR